MIRAMIVDDEHLVRVGLKMTMPWDQFSIEVAGEARNAEEALMLLEKESFDLMFIDISMPGMNGLELLGLMRTRYPDISTVILTCHQEFEYAQKAIRLGAVDYLVKTQLELDVMEQALERIVARISQDRPEQVESRILSASVPSSEEMEQLWFQVRWIMDDELLDQMISTLQQISADHCAGILQSASTYWADCLPVYAGALKIDAADTYDRIDQALRWMKDIRQAAVSRLIRTNYTEEVITQILIAVDYIHHCEGKQPSQAELCMHVNMSRSYFSRCFRDIVGVSYTTYIQNVGLNRAKWMLMETNYPVYRIAEEVGFQDEKYFSKLFRERTGFLPSQYRSSR